MVSVLVYVGSIHFPFFFLNIFILPGTVLSAYFLNNGFFYTYYIFFPVKIELSDFLLSAQGLSA